MALIHLSEGNYVISSWSGGLTKQIAIAPPCAMYADRDFLWRVSSASGESEVSDFTVLPDYHRWITPLTGRMELSHGGGERIVLTPYEVYQFDGAAATRSQGRYTDFNLMLRKGRTDGLMYSLHLSAGSACDIEFKSGVERWFSDSVLLVFCGRGMAVVALESEKAAVSACETVLLERAAGSSIRAEAVMDSDFIIVEIQF